MIALSLYINCPLVTVIAEVCQSLIGRMCFLSQGNDLQGVRAYAGVDAEGLFTLGTVVVDYRGYRVTAQSIIPGTVHLGLLMLVQALLFAVANYKVHSMSCGG